MQIDIIAKNAFTQVATNVIVYDKREDEEELFEDEVLEEVPVVEGDPVQEDEGEVSHMHYMLGAFHNSYLKTIRAAFI